MDSPALFSLIKENRELNFITFFYLLHFLSEREAHYKRGAIQIKKKKKSVTLVLGMSFLVHLIFTVCIHRSNSPFTLDENILSRNLQHFTAGTQMLLRLQLEGQTLQGQGNSIKSHSWKFISISIEFLNKLKYQRFPS